MILLSLALVVATAATLAWGVFAANDPLVWVSLAVGLGAVASVAGSVVRHRRHLMPEAIPDAGLPTTGATAVGGASAGVDPAPSPTPSRPAPAPAAPAAGPVSPPGARPDVPPHAQSWPWATPPPGAPGTGTRPGWTGPVPVPLPDQPTASPPTSPPASPVAHPPPESPSPAGSAVGDPVAADAVGPEAPGLAGAEEAAGADEPALERVDLRDALRIAQLPDEVLVVDGHPRYHLAGCPALAGAGTVPLAVSTARRGGFTPCAVCTPDATLLARSRDRARQKAQDRSGEWPSDEGQHI